MDDKIKAIEQELRSIRDRNQRVEADKAWETSTTRVIAITSVTYIVAGFVLYLIGIAKPFLAALIPAIGYYLSVQSLPMLKRSWVRNFLKSRGSRNA
ncbi:MAG: hypothetical protein AAB490_06160 [Patescibacteria group bacterium]